jgi:hypothetical protein
MFWKLVGAKASCAWGSICPSGFTYWDLNSMLPSVAKSQLATLSGTFLRLLRRMQTCSIARHTLNTYLLARAQIVAQHKALPNVAEKLLRLVRRRLATASRISRDCIVRNATCARVNPNVLLCYLGLLCKQVAGHTGPGDQGFERGLAPVPQLYVSIAKTA